MRTNYIHRGLPWPCQGMLDEHLSQDGNSYVVMYVKQAYLILYNDEQNKDNDNKCKSYLCRSLLQASDRRQKTRLMRSTMFQQAW